MSIADHVAILLFSSLDQPRAGKSNPNKVEFYTTIALPPAAANDLADQMKTVAPNGNLAGLRLTIEPNSKKAKPIVGVPDDYLILRLSSGPDYPPELFTEEGKKLTALPVHGTEIRTAFYAGNKVRINGYPYFWDKTSIGAGKGISWNLSGVMAVGGGERRAGGAGEPSESAFAKYRGESAPAQNNVPAQQTQAASDSNPFQQGGASNNPFA